MGRFEIEFAQFTKVVVDAETEEEAKDLQNYWMESCMTMWNSRF